MSAATPRPLTVDRIVDAAYDIVRRHGLGALSMRALGTALGVDPMAIYHHVANKQKLLTLVTERALSQMVEPHEGDAAWDRRIERWALAYWDVVTEHRELTLAGLADPTIAAGGRSVTRSLVDAIADSGLPPELVEPTMFVIVDAVHGSALSAVTQRHEQLDLEALRAAFEEGLRTIVAGIAARADVGRPRR